MGNYIKTAFLLGILSVILITLGRLFGGVSGMYMALILALVMNGAAYFFSDKIALMASGAKPLSKNKAPKIYKIVEGLAKDMKMPMPKLYITKASQANAFATGRSPNHASVAVTKGLLDILSDKEIKAVLAHELGHVKNRDILIVTIAAVMASAVSFIAHMSMFSGQGNDRDRNNSGAFGLVVALLIPLAASLIQMAISREREYKADETGAKIVGTGQPLASALVAIHNSVRRNPLNVNPAFSSLYIGNPFGGGGNLLNLFSTHPPVEERVKRLKTIK